MLDVRRLRILREVARCGSLTGAASVLSYTPSAVSQQIATLEREVGTALLERRPRGVVLTEAGRVLVGHAEEVLARLDAAEAALDDLANLRRGRLRMASFATAASTVLPGAVDAFRGRHPDIELTVMPASPADSVAALRDGRLDLALTVDVTGTHPDAVAVVKLFDDPFRLALPRSHPRAGAPDVRLHDLADETWIDVPDTVSGGKALRAACRRAGFEPKVRFESDDYLAILELVAAGAGLALLPELALHQPHDGVVLRDLGPDGPRRAIEAATRAERFRSPAAEAMLAVLLELGRAARFDAQPVTAPPSR